MGGRAVFHFLLSCACVLGVIGLPEYSTTDEGYNVQNSEVCRTCKNVVLQIINVLRPPCFNLVHRLRSIREKYLLGMMQEAANSDPSFRFSATFFNKELGFFVDAYNGVSGNFSKDKSYWQILDGSLNPTRFGVSNYVPQDGEVVTFNLTVGY